VTTAKPARKARPPRSYDRLAARDQMWALIRKLRRFTVTDLRKAGVSKQVRISFLEALLGNGIVRRVGEQPGRRGWTEAPVTVYELEQDPGVLTPRFDRDGKLDTTPSTADRMWAAMKPLPSFSIPEIASLARAPRSTTARYVSFLLAAGYLAELSPGGGYHRQGRYRLKPRRNTGPRAPVVRQNGAVWDANERRQVLAPRKERQAAQAAAVTPEEIAA